MRRSTTVEVRAVVEVQCAPHPLHAPPVPRRPGVVALAGDVAERVRPAVGGHRARHGAWDLVARREPVLVGRSHGGPGQVHRRPRPAARARRAAAPPDRRRPARARAAPPGRSAAVPTASSTRSTSSVRTRVCSSGSGASKSSTAMVGMSGPHSSALIQAWPWLGIRPSRIHPPTSCRGVGEVEVPALAPQRLVGPAGARPRLRRWAATVPGADGCGRIASASVSRTC